VNIDKNMRILDKLINKDKSVQLKMVVVPAIKGQMKKQFHNLITTVEEITKFKIIIEESPTYKDATESLKSGAAQIGWLGPEAYLEGAHEANIEAFAVAVRGKEHRSTYRTIFLTRADSEINSLSDLRGKRLV